MRTWIPVLLRLTPAQHAKAEQIAEERGDSISGALRHALMRYELATAVRTPQRERRRRGDIGDADAIAALADELLVLPRGRPRRHD